MSLSSITIYDVDGSEISTVKVTKNAEHVTELMTSDYVKLSYSSITGDTLPIGAYITFNGNTYRLTKSYTPEMKSDKEYKYEPEFHSAFMCLQIKPFFFLDKDSQGNITNRETSWQLTGTVTDFLDDLIASILDETGKTYTYSFDSSLTGSKTLSFENTDIISGLNQIVSENGWNCEWWVIGTVIYVGTAKYGDGVTLKVGDNISYPTSISKSGDGCFTRFYAFGSTRNITQDYQSGKSINYVVDKRLALPASTCPNGYKDIRENLDANEVAVKVLTFDDIYPRSYLTISDVRQEINYVRDDDGNKVQIGTDDHGDPVYETYPVFCFKIPGLDFSNVKIIDGKKLTAYFSSGNLQGFEFGLEYHAGETSDKDEFEIVIDQSTGTIIPNEILIPADGDKIVLCNIEMPDEYVTAAEEELEKALDEEMPKYTSDHNTYTVNSNPVKFGEEGTELSVGMAVTYVNGDYSLSTRVTKITEKLDFPCIKEINVGEEQKVGTTQQLKDEVTSVSNSVKALTALTDVYNAIINSLSNSTSNTAVKLLGYWKKTELVESGQYLRLNEEKIYAGNADQLGERDAADYYHIKNANLLTVNWAAKSMNVAELYKVNGVQISSQNLSDYSVLARKDGTLQNNLNADLLDGIHGSQFLRRDIAQTVNADTSWNGSLSALNGFSAGLSGVSYLEMLNNLVAVKKDIGSDAYASGFSGSGWRIDPADNRLTVDNLTVRKEMSVYELVINQIRGTNGALWVSDSAKVAGISGTRLTIDTGGSSTLVPFVVNDLIRCQRWTGNNIKYYVARVTAVGSNYIDVTKTDGTSAFEAGDEIVRIGNTSNAGRQGALYLTASDNNAPYLDVLDGVVSADLTGKTKVRLGKLDGITDANFGALTGYGMYAENVYLNGSASLTGAIKQASNKWSLNSDGSGRLASGNIIFDASGNVTFGSSVSLNWTSAASTAETNAKNYVASTKGIQLLSNDWTIGSGSVGMYNVNGSSSENYRVYGASPDGQQVILWECRPDANSGADGGWNTSSVPIDKTKTYRFSVFMKTSANTGYSYLGCGANSVCSLNTTTVIGNPYFWNGDLPAQNKWYLIVGYVYPYNTTGLSYSGGIWDCETGEKVVSNVNCFNWANVTTTYHRCYHFYDTTTSTRQWMWNPRIDMVDGNEPSIVNLIGIAETPTGAQTKASAAQSAAISTAASDATTKANNAKSGAISTAASDATTKANSAKSSAISTASSDATTKANSALSSAKSYTNSALGGASFPKLTKLTSTGVYTGTLTASQVNAAKATVLGAVTAGSFSLGSGRFQVNASGYLTATGATISGNITATSGTFTGTVNASSGTIGGFSLSSTTLSGTSSSGKIYIKHSTDRFAYLNYSSTTLAYFRADGGTAIRIYTEDSTGIGLYITGQTGSHAVESYGNVSLTARSGEELAFTGKIVSASGYFSGFRMYSRRVTSSLTLSDLDNVVLAMPSGNITLTLPSSPKENQIYFIRRCTSHTITMKVGNTSTHKLTYKNTSNGATTLSFSDWATLILIWDNTDRVWWASATKGM